MREYPKTENLFVRDPETHKLIPGELRNPEHAQVRDWLVTEKVDGTNIRILLRYMPEYDTVECRVRGRSDNANLPPGIMELVQGKDKREPQVTAFVREMVSDKSDVIVCLYGEGYGPGIQKCGVRYRDDKSIRLFDVTTTMVDENDEPVGRRRWWRDWDTVVRAAEAFDLQTVPVLNTRRMSLDEISGAVTQGFGSRVARHDGGDHTLPAEGVIARTDPYLFTARGDRVMFKLKTRDLN